MPDYRRNRVSGGTYFFTVNLRDRRDNLLVAEIEMLRTAVLAVKRSRPFHVDAWVVLPEHMHCIWTLPADDADFSTRWKEIKALFARAQPKTEHRSAARIRPDERGIWQRRFWEHSIRDDREYAAHMDYVHFNPVKHGLVREGSAWRFSSFHRCVTMGLYPAQWDGGVQDLVEGVERR